MSRPEIVAALHAAIPAGARVLIPFREWYVFVGRNPAIGLEGRSLPMFQTSLVRSVHEFGVEYMVLVRDPVTLDSPYYWVSDDSAAFAEYLRTQTLVVRMTGGGQYGEFEVRRVGRNPGSG